MKSIRGTDFIFIGDLEEERRKINKYYCDLMSEYDKIEVDIQKISTKIATIECYEDKENVVSPNKEISSIISKILIPQYNDMVINSQSLSEKKDAFTTGARLHLQEEIRIENIRLNNLQRQIYLENEQEYWQTGLTVTKKSGVTTTIMKLFSFIASLFKK